MPPPLQSSGNPNAVSTSHGTTAGESYNTPPSHLHSYAFSHGTPTFVPTSSHQSVNATSRGFGPSMTSLSSSTSGSYSLSQSAMQLDPPPYQLAAQIVPPFEQTQTSVPIMDAQGSQVFAELHAKIDKGFFKADQDWTCYRRNYFSVACSYSLKPPYTPGSDTLFIQRANGTSREPLRALAICITARVSGDDARPIDLVQHTPKRDKGPLGRPQKIRLMPCPSGSSGVYSEPSGPSPSSQLSPDYESSYGASSPNSQQTPTLASFDRIQFKNATANNGKRRAAQQYFHIVVELFAEVPGRESTETQWTKVASRTSAPMVVRGRSPGHYQDDRRGSSTNMGPGGGSGGDSTGGPREPSANGSSGPSRSGLSSMPFSSSSRLGGSTYLSHHASMEHSPPGSSSSGSSGYNGDPGMVIDRPGAPAPSPEEVTNIEEYDGYQYYPGPLYETNANSFAMRPQLPPVRSSMTKPGIQHPSLNQDVSFGLFSRSPGIHDGRPESENPPKPEHGGNTSVGGGAAQYASSSRSWTSTSGNVHSFGGRGCGRFQGVDTSLGYYPMAPAL
jgi:meiosis-specific transcription factor NDT80